MRRISRAIAIVPLLASLFAGRSAAAHDVDHDWAHQSDDNEESARPRRRTPEPAAKPPGEAPTRPRRSLVVSINPAALFLRRVSIAVEYSPFAHHGFVLSLSGVHTSYQPDSYAAAPCPILPCGGGPRGRVANLVNGAIAELGWRLYTGSSGPTGLFIGPSGVVGLLAANGDAYTLAGAALDAGAQIVTESGFTVTAALGVQLQRVSESFSASNFATGAVTQSGVAPRAIGAVGWAF